MVAILHDGVDWWPNLDPGPDGSATRARSDRLAAVARPWAGEVDLIVGGHVPDAWAGELAGGAGWFQVPAVRPARRTPATDALPDAGGAGEPASLAVLPWVVPRLGELLGRELAGEPAATGARAALLRVLERAQAGR